MLNDRLGNIGPYLADTLVVLGIIIMTLGVIGIVRMPDVYTKMHAASKAVFLGTISFTMASIVTNEWEIIARVILISGILMVTTPIASQVIARAAAIEHELMRTPGAVDESVYDLVLRDELAYLPVERGESVGAMIRDRKQRSELNGPLRHPHATGKEDREVTP
ncbi:MAG: monovalent cation/H(+) antiporter subunit G [Thermomicrobiales bacterium]|nr:monovalent cation/H(+) antiporter subunit G [Thermomicrobiales bacterium]MCO5222115.1 monovalent cation/H(+) antiporter subunit G [Thermomicrobiales bacterium]